jgi:hypothetical protein
MKSSHQYSTIRGPDETPLITAGIIAWDTAMLFLTVIPFRHDGVPGLIPLATLLETIAVRVRVFLP